MIEYARVLAATLLVCATGSALGARAAPNESTRDTGYIVYVTNEMSGDLSVIDGASNRVVARVALGKRPRGIAATRDGSQLFVALSGSPITPPGSDESKAPPADKTADGIGIVDRSQRVLTKVVRGVSDPEQLAVSADGDRFYIASEDTGRAVIIDAATGGMLANVAVGGEPEGVALSPDGRVVYVTSEEHHSVAALDTRTHALLATLTVGERPRDVAFSPDGRFAYVSGENDASLTLIDARKHVVVRKVRLTGAGVRPKGVVVSPDGTRVYVSTGRGGTVKALEATSLREIGDARVGARPWGIALSPDGKRLFTANGTSNDVSVVDTQTLQTIATITVGDRPWGVIAIANGSRR